MTEQRAQVLARYAAMSQSPPAEATNSAYQLSRETPAYAVHPLGGSSPVTLPPGTTFTINRGFSYPSTKAKYRHGVEILVHCGHMVFTYHLLAKNLIAF